MIRDAVTEVEDHAAAVRGHYVRRQNALLIEDAVLSRRIDMRDDIAALEQRENGSQRGIVLADMYHDRQIERRCDLLRAAQGFEVVGTCDILRQARLDADDDIPI